MALRRYQELKRQHAAREEANKLALENLKANPLRVEPWMTRCHESDWVPFFCNAGAQGGLRSWGVREALRLCAACRRCKLALEADAEWRALLYLSRQRTPSSIGGSTAAIPSAKDLAVAHERIMHHCLRDPSFEMRFELGGIDDELVEEYKTHKALKFAVGHTCLGGAVAHVQLGYWDHNHTLEDDWDSADWTAAPRDFLNQFQKKSTEAYAVAYYKNETHTIAEAYPALGNGACGVGFEGINYQAPLMQAHTCGDRQFCCQVIFHLELYIPATAFCHFVGLGLHQSYPTWSLGELPLPDVPAPADITQDSSLSLVGVIWSSHGIDLYPDRKDNFNRRQRDFSFPFHGELSLKPVESSLADIQSEVRLKDRARIALGAMMDNFAADQTVSHILGIMSELIVQNISRLADANGAMSMPIPDDLEADTVSALASLVDLAGGDGASLRGMSAIDALDAVAKHADVNCVCYDASISPIDGWEWMETCYEVDRVSLLAFDACGLVRFQIHGLEMRDPRFNRRRGRREEVRCASAMKGTISASFTPGQLRLTFADTDVADEVIYGYSETVEEDE